MTESMDMDTKMQKFDEEIEQILDLLEEKAYFRARDEILKHNEVDIAEILEEILEESGIDKTIIIYRMLPKDISAEVFSYLPSDDQREIIQGITEAAMEEKVRPALRSHGGDISIDHVEGKTVYVKLLGQCAGCPSADLTNETIVEAELKAALPDLVEKAVVVQTVSDELWEQAKKLLREHHL